MAETEYAELISKLRSLQSDEMLLAAGAHHIAEALSSLLAENARLKEALPPFGNFFDGFRHEGWKDDDTLIDFLDSGFGEHLRQLKVGDFRRARAALHGDPQ